MSSEQAAIQPATVWSPPEVLQELAGEGDLIAELIETFTMDVAERMQVVRTALPKADRAAVRAQVHAIKGSSKQMAAFQVAQICEQIEAGIDAPAAALAEMVTLLERSIAEICKAMDWYQRLANKRAS